MIPTTLIDPTPYPGKIPPGTEPNRPELATLINCKPIDNGFYQIDAATAKTVCGGTLPRHGHEYQTTLTGYPVTIARTLNRGKLVWSIRYRPGERITPAD